MKSTSTNLQDYYEPGQVATERDPLLLSSPSGYNSNSISTIRERRPATASPTGSSRTNQPKQRYYRSRSSPAMRNNGISHSGEGETSVPSRSYDQGQVASGGTSSYDIYNENSHNGKPIRSLRSIRSNRSQQMSRGSLATRTHSERDNPRPYGGTDKLHDYYNERAKSIFDEQNHQEELLVDISPEVMAVRRSALKVYEPLTYTWLIFTVGFSVCAAISMARWTGLLPKVTFWFLLLPCWSSHICLIGCHLYSARTLFRFINEANSKRHRSDSTDHIDRVEYLPLLQKALKFGLKTGALSLSLFIFEILLYYRLAFGSLRLIVVFLPIWIIVVFGIIDGIICKTQHISRVFSWLLALSFMVLLVLRFDYDYEEELRLRVLLGPLATLLAIATLTLIYILYGNQIGYFRLSESQLNAGILYSLGILGAATLCGMFFIMHMARPNIFEMRVVMVALAPLSVALMGLGAWAVSRDEYDRLLQNGGQSSVQPMKLRLEKSGWSAIESKGATIIPMFGEVRYEPLDPSTKTKNFELCICCTCYPYEDEEEGILQSSDYPTFADTMPALRIPSSTIG